jgi:hypothetical protein
MNGYPPQFPGSGMQGAQAMQQGGANASPYGQYGYMQQSQQPQPLMVLCATSGRQTSILMSMLMGVLGRGHAGDLL